MTRTADLAVVSGTVLALGCDRSRLTGYGPRLALADEVLE